MNQKKVNIIIPSVWTGIYINIARLLKFSFEDLGFVVSVQESGENLDNDLSIVLGWNLIPNTIKFRQPYIIYQLEPLVLPHWQDKLQERKHIFQEASCIWDYSEANQEYLNRLGLVASVVILGYHLKMNNPCAYEYPDYDVLFTGFLTDRRKRILEDLQRYCSVSYQPRWGKDFLDALGRSKILLNLHQYDCPTPMEQPRISYALNNNSMVISETSIDTPYKALITCDYNMITETTLEVLYQPIKLRQLKDHCFSEFSVQNMVVNMKNVLKNVNNQIKDTLATMPVDM